MIKGFWLALSIFSNVKKMIITQQEPFLDWELHEAVALSISWNFWLHYLILVVPAFFVGFACFCTGGSFFLWRALQCHLVLGDVAQKKKGKRTHKLSNFQPQKQLHIYLLESPIEVCKKARQYCMVEKLILINSKLWKRQLQLRSDRVWIVLRLPRLRLDSLPAMHRSQGGGESQVCILLEGIVKICNK